MADSDLGMPAPAVVTQPSIATLYLDALVAYDRDLARRLVEEARAAAPLERIYVEILQPALEELGERWERGEITVAQEHYCTAATQHLMTGLHGDLFEAPRGTQRLLAASVGGNQHSVGIRMVADVFEVHGWTTMFVGADAPTEAILATLAREQFDVLAISAALADQLPEVEALIAAVRARCLVRILVGGRAFADDPARWKQIGADAYAATPADAVALAATLVVPPAARPPLALVEPAPPDPDARTLAAISEINTELHDLARTLAAKNAELARLNAQLNRLMAVLAHDLRNPISAVMYHSEFLRDDLAAVLGPEQREFLDAIDQSTQFMKVLVDDLLDVSRLRSGKPAIPTEAVDLVELVQRVSKLNVHLARRKSIELRTTSSHDVLPARVDPGKLQQVVNNLVGNAIQYSPPHSSVEIELVAAAGEVAILVRDHGPGIAESERAKVFLPFETGRAKGTAGEKSTGLGLAIVQAIVEAHDGQVTIESTPGAGATFRVWLPLR